MTKRIILLITIFLFLISFAGVLHAEEPALPQGLEDSAGGSDEPALPSGLSGGNSGNAEPALPSGLGGGSNEPALPSGLGSESNTGMEEGTGDAPALPPGLGGKSNAVNQSDSFFDEEEPQGSVFSGVGFWEARGGRRIHEDPWQQDTSIGEIRLQLDGTRRYGSTSVNLTIDGVFDSVVDDHDVYLNQGKGWIDLRQANVAFTPLSFMDVKLGRQILTWGTGDLLFINDNFPKDWVSFFIGRDTEYLKAPSDAVKASVFTNAVNVDLVYTPQFDPDRYISGERISYYNTNTGTLAGRNAVIETDRPDDVFDDDEVAARVYRTIAGYELALYYYYGFWKSPAGQNLLGKATFPKLAVTGGSIRGVVLGGIGNIEVGYMDSRNDDNGRHPLVRNSEWRYLVGYEKDLGFIADDLTLGVQYYVERMDDYDAYKSTLPAGIPNKDETRQVITTRITKLLMQQNLTLSIFAYYSPSDDDCYLRPRIDYKLTDHWQIGAGGNIFDGEEQHTFFGQFEENSNVYAMVRYSF
ncbi:MAG: hypothetical protein SWH61_11420 [Thermodesulfobacteriota bacterium]|nr:hypothetical protein [Thermodesulfobacteriota bacterium]